MFGSDVLELAATCIPPCRTCSLPVITVMLVLAVRAGQSVGQIALLVRRRAGLEPARYVIHRCFIRPWVEDETRAVTASLSPGQAVIPALPTWRHKFYFLVHGVHHDYPNDSGRLVMPPSVSIPLAVIFFFLFQWAIGPLTPAAFAGLVGGYLAYDTTHYLTHHSPGKTALGRYQKKRHFRHHYYDSTRNFGVSSPLWDAIWGTMGRNR
jgi:hypothetical protein